MSVDDARHPKTANEPHRGEAPVSACADEAPAVTNGNARPGSTTHLMAEVVQADNVRQALKRVEQNKGSGGIDGMSVQELRPHLKQHWPSIRQRLLTGTYQPQAVRRHMIPKPGGGERELGIPTVLDRFIQQAIVQVLQPRLDPTFSEHSYGFRPNRRAHDAVSAAQRYVEQGKSWVVDIDLEKFFDRVNHDVLMGRLAKRIEDKSMLRLIRRYLEAGVMAGGVVIERHEGTPQGGPLSPLLANVLLDEVDKELERRGHAFVRYADDANVYVSSRRAGERVMVSLRKQYAKLRLQVNESKSTVAPVWERKFLGFSFQLDRGNKVKRRVADAAIDTMKKRVRKLTGRNSGRSMASIVQELRAYLQGWKVYFRFAEVRAIFGELDRWIRRRLRVIQLRQWKSGTTTFERLVGRGIARPIATLVAARSRRYWWITHQRSIFVALPDALFDSMGVPRLAR